MKMTCVGVFAPFHSADGLGIRSRLFLLLSLTSPVVPPNVQNK